MDIKEQIEKIENLYPNIKIVEVDYNGSGDSFDSFYQTSEPDVDLYKEEISDLLWYLIDNSEADFNNDGSRGTIIIDIENKKCSIDNYWYSLEETPSGLIEFE